MFPGNASIASIRARSRFPLASVMIGAGLSGPANQPFRPSKTRRLMPSVIVRIHVRWFGDFA